MTRCEAASAYGFDCISIDRSIFLGGPALPLLRMMREKITRMEMRRQRGDVRRGTPSLSTSQVNSLKSTQLMDTAGLLHESGWRASPTKGADFFARWVRQACGSAPLGGWGLSGAIWALQRNPEANPEASYK